MKKNLLISIILASSLSMANNIAIDFHTSNVKPLASENTVSDTTKRNAEDIDIGEVPNTVFLNHNVDTDTWTVYGHGKIKFEQGDDNPHEFNVTSFPNFIDYSKYNEIILANIKHSDAKTVIIFENGVQLPNISRGLFSGFNGSKITYPENLDASNVTNMCAMYENTPNLTTITNLPNNTPNVEDMSFMFYNSPMLKNINFDNLNTSNVNDMQSMFYGNSNLKTINVTNWNTQNVKNMRGMFENCTQLTEIIGLEVINTEKINNIAKMFDGDTNIKSLNVSNFKPTRYMFNMFNKYNINEGLTINSNLLIKYNDNSEDKTNISIIRPTNSAPLNRSISIGNDKRYEIIDTNTKEVLAQVVGSIGIDTYNKMKPNTIYLIKPAIIINKDDNPTKSKVQQLDLTKYNKYLKTFNSYDTTITNGFSKGLYINANVGDLFSLVNKFEPTNLITKAQVGYTFDTHGVLLTPFAEYYKEKAYNVTLGLGTSYKDLKTFVRYRLATLDKKVSNNIDLYVNYAHKFNIKDFYITPEIGGLGTYGIKTKLDDDVYLNNRVYGTLDGGVTLGYNLQNLSLYTKQQGRVSFDNTNIYQESNEDNMIKSDKLTWEYKGIYGINKTINNNVKVGSNISLGINSDKEIKTDLGVNLGYMW